MFIDDNKVQLDRDILTMLKRLKDNGEKIKSINNNGTWDKNNDNIYQ